MHPVCFPLNLLLLTSTFRDLDNDQVPMCRAPEEYILGNTDKFSPQLVAASSPLDMSDRIIHVPATLAGAWIWDLPCIEKEKDFSSKKKYEYSEKAGEYEPTLLKWHTRFDKPCFNPNGCFRAVFDHFVSDDELDELRKIHDNEPAWLGRQARFNEENPTLRTIIFNRTGNLLERMFNLQDPPIVTRYFQRRSAVLEKDINKHHWSELHPDAQAMKLLQYSAVLHLDDDTSGGETIFVDAVEKRDISVHGDEKKTIGRSDFVVNAGVLVEPKAGRLVLFSGGAENFHEKRRIVRGKRSPLVYWYDCE